MAKRPAKSPTHVTLIACPKCKGKAHLISASPLPAGLKGEMRTFVCRRCGKHKIIVAEESVTGSEA